MKKLFVFLCLVITSVISFHCQKEVSYDIGIPGTTPVTRATVQGNIVDENGLPVSGATIKIGTRTLLTDGQGFFRIERAPLKEDAAFVAVEKAGYFKAFRSFIASPAANHIQIQLTKKTLSGTIPAIGGEVVLSNGAKVSLPALGTVTIAGNAYTGNIQVYAAYIDPTAASIMQTVPGSFMANDRNNHRVTLSSYGMMAVELESATGEKLQIAPGINATLTMPIPSSILSSAPATIPLWFIDEATGAWQEQGTANKVGNEYVGKVSHFSFWNCDIPVPVITLSLKLKDSKGSPLVHVPVRLYATISGSPSVVYSYTDSVGAISGLVPANANMLLEVLDPCNNAIYSQNIGPFNQSTNLGTLTVTNTGNSLLTISGKIMNCTGSPVANGYATITYQNMSSYVSTNANGEFTLTFTRCGGSALTYGLTVVDNIAQQQQTFLGLPVTLPVSDAGILNACGTSSVQYINYTINGTDFQLSSTIPDSISGRTSGQMGNFYSSFNANSNVNTNKISLWFSSNQEAPGTYAVNSISVNTYPGQSVVPPFTITLNSFPVIAGDFYQGTFNGSFRDSLTTSPVKTISGNFRIRKN